MLIILTNESYEGMTYVHTSMQCNCKLVITNQNQHCEDVKKGQTDQWFSHQEP